MRNYLVGAGNAKLPVGAMAYIMVTTKTDGRKSDWEARTDFQRWLKPLLVANKGTGKASNYRELYEALRARGVDVTENHIYKIVRGDPAKYPTNKRPGYEVAVAIGEILGDVTGAVRAADFPAVATTATASSSDGRQITRVLDADAVRVLDAYEGIPQVMQQAAIQLLQTMRATDEKYRARTDIIGKHADSDDYERVSIDEE